MNTVTSLLHLSTLDTEMTLKFTPPKLANRYALFVEHDNDRGTFKVYKDLGSVKNAWYHSAGRYNASKILELVDGDWYVLYDIPKGTERRDTPWYQETTRYDYYGRGNTTAKRAKSMTRDEYADWRVKVEREKLGLDN